MHTLSMAALGCGAPRYSLCLQCGQSLHQVNIPLKHLLAEVLEDLLHFDGKSIQTVKALLLKPGRLTTDFLHWNSSTGLHFWYS